MIVAHPQTEREKAEREELTQRLTHLASLALGDNLGFGLGVLCAVIEALGPSLREDERRFIAAFLRHVGDALEDSPWDVERVLQ